MNALQQRVQLEAQGRFGALSVTDTAKANAAMVTLANGVVAAFNNLVDDAQFKDPDVYLRWAAEYVPLLGLAMPDTANVTAARDANISTLRTQIEKWGTTYRYWALNGRRDDGTPYSAEMWLDFMGTLRSAIKAYDASLWDDSMVKLFAEQMAVAGGELADMAKKKVDQMTGFLGWLYDNKNWLIPVAGGALVLVYFGPALGILATSSAKRRAAG